MFNGMHDGTQRMHFGQIEAGFQRPLGANMILCPAMPLSAAKALHHKRMGSPSLIELHHISVDQVNYWIPGNHSGNPWLQVPLIIVPACAHKLRHHKSCLRS